LSSLTNDNFSERPDNAASASGKSRFGIVAKFGDLGQPAICGSLMIGEADGEAGKEHEDFRAVR
jgi:hypothetical protein